MSVECADRITKAYRLLGTIASNVAFVRGEIPSLDMPHGSRAEITELRDGFDSALYDIRKEVRVLEDKLGLHPGEEPFDPGIVNTDPSTTISLIMGWLRREMGDLHAVVMNLRGLTEREPEMGTVEVRVGESGANILNAFNAINDELRLISASLVERPHTR